MSPNSPRTPLIRLTLVAILVLLSFIYLITCITTGPGGVQPHPVFAWLIGPASTTSSSTLNISNVIVSSQFGAWLAAFNSHDKDVMLSYHAEHFPYDVASRDVGNINHELVLSTATGGFELIKVVSETEYSIDNILRELNRPRFARAKMEVDPRSGSVSKFDIHPTYTPLEFAPEDRKAEFTKALAPLTSTKRTCIVEDISAAVQQRYVFPEEGKKMSKYIHDKLEQGIYDNYTDSEDFAKKLLSDLHEVSGDGHISLMFIEPPGHNNDNKHRMMPEEFFDILKTINFGFKDPEIEKVEDKNLGFLTINGFVPCTTDVASDFGHIQQAISDILSKVAEADALVIDIRRNGGGHPGTVAFILSYLLDGGPLRLLDIMDRNETVQETFSTLPELEFPENAARFGGSKPLFILTSKNTISGGEELAYDLQAFKRANLIIGEDSTTAGAANIVEGPVFLCENEFGKHWWMALIPSLRPVNSISGTNWGGVGVRSDVIVEAGQDARDVARGLALEALGLKLTMGTDKSQIEL